MRIGAQFLLRPVEPVQSGFSNHHRVTFRQFRRRNYAHRVAKACSDQGHSQAWASLIGHPGSEIDGRNCNSARARDSCVGEFLPDPLLPVMGAVRHPVTIFQRPCMQVSGKVCCAATRRNIRLFVEVTG